MPEITATTMSDTPNGVASNLWNKGLNGSTHISVTKAEAPAAEDTSVWPILQQWLPARKPDWDHWWNLSAPHMATMLKEAGYSIHQQYEALLFHYHYVVPRLGAMPDINGHPRFESPLGPDGCPIEYSFKWDQNSSDPDVRYAVACYGDYTGSSADPFNIESTKDIIYQLSLKFPSIDLTWFNQLTSLVYDSHKANYTSSGGLPTTTMLVGFELLKTGLMLKAYFIVTESLRQGISAFDRSFWYSAVNEIVPSSSAAEKVFNFLAYDHYGQKLNPAVLAIDCVVPSKSRFKFYHHTPDTSFKAVRSIMTLGGKIKGLEDQLNDLHSLIKAVVGLPSDFPETEQVPTTTAKYDDGLQFFNNVPEVMSGYILYFDIKPGADLPDIKIYVPTRNYSQSDALVAGGLGTWMKDHGRGKYVENYDRILQSICTHRGLDEGNGLHSFVSCAISKGELAITSYLEPEPYHPRRFGK